GTCAPSVQQQNRSDDRTHCRLYTRTSLLSTEQRLGHTKVQHIADKLRPGKEYNGDSRPSADDALRLHAVPLRNQAGFSARAARAALLELTSYFALHSAPRSRLQAPAGLSWPSFVKRGTECTNNLDTLKLDTAPCHLREAGAGELPSHVKAGRE